MFYLSESELGNEIQCPRCALRVTIRQPPFVKTAGAPVLQERTMNFGVMTALVLLLIGAVAGYFASFVLR